MSSPPSSPLRWITPGQFAICIVLFFLPWIEIQCGVPDFANLGNLGKLNNPANGAKPEVKVVSWRPLMTQSGLEAATGEYTITDPDLRAMMDQGQKAAKQAGGPVVQSREDNKPKAAPLLWAYLLAAVVGVVVGLAMPTGTVRKLILVVCCAVALIAAGGQAAAGFPVEQDIKEQKKEQGKGEADEFLRAKYQMPFYLALLFVVGALVTTLAEPATVVRRPRQMYDFDEGSIGESPPSYEPPPP